MHKTGLAQSEKKHLKYTPVPPILVNRKLTAVTSSNFNRFFMFLLLEILLRFP